ncbi:MAG: polysaccharide deacetylase family protein [Opitutaceae bacterium]|nr:polysaccharide deacetylase family protein [Opitutaceae bacterium]
MSFHDLHPGSRAACTHFIEGLAGLGITRISLLVVPRWHGDAPFTEDAAFTAWLRGLAAAGHDICLHGFFHQAEAVTGNAVNRLVGTHYTAGEGEYYQIDRATARDRIDRGLHILAGEAGLPVVGFTPPAWLLSADGRAELVAAGLHYTTTFGAVDLLQLDRQLRAPTIVYSCRAAWRRGVSRIWVRFWAWVNAGAPILRIAAHPCDFDHPSIEASLWTRVRAALADGRTPATYRDLLPGAAELAPIRPRAAA